MQPSTILQRIPRTAFRAHKAPLFRKPQVFRYASTASARATGRAAPEWGAQWKRVGGSALMYFPVVGVVMFWPYLVMPVMEYFEEKW